ncbi:unnamed protein product [Rhizophagus irregularis]|uniref:BTB domain-containing protein n=1 Tax=Rhizophagus irregularis TaxID=588596 RepID=A0A916E6L4_9GLOM|nr:unnamed protein product [Rhizophagus irregularis]
MCLELSEIDPEIFEMIITYIYTGMIDFSNATSEKIFSFLITSSKLNLSEATSFTQSYLVDNEKNWIHENFSKVLNNVFKLENYLDNLYIEEIDLWDFLIEWGMNQLHKIHNYNININYYNNNNNISIFINNNNNYDDNDDEENQKNHKFINNINKEIMNQQHKSPKWKIREALKKILDPLIYRIRFREISSDDFYEKIKPYKMMIPMEIYEDIMSYYLIGTSTKSRISRILENSKYSIYDCKDFNLLLNFGNGDLILDGTIGICDKSNYEFCILNNDERCFEAEQLEVFSVQLID